MIYVNIALLTESASLICGILYPAILSLQKLWTVLKLK